MHKSRRAPPDRRGPAAKTTVANEVTPERVPRGSAALATVAAAAVTAALAVAADPASGWTALLLLTGLLPAARAELLPGRGLFCCCWPGFAGSDWSC